MKRFVVSILLAFVIGQSNLGATRMVEFMSIAWGSSRSEAANKMADLDNANDPIPTPMLTTMSVCLRPGSQILQSKDQIKYKNRSLYEKEKQRAIS